MDCTKESDGRGMIATGWALWGLVGLDQRQAYDFIYDGYREWREAGAPEPERIAFLTAVFDRLHDIHPPIAPTDDLSSVPHSVAAPASVYYGARCWAGSELLSVASSVGRLTPELEERIYTAFAETHRAFMPPRTLTQFQEASRNRGMPEPG